MYHSILFGSLNPNTNYNISLGLTGRNKVKIILANKQKEMVYEVVDYQFNSQLKKQMQFRAKIIPNRAMTSRQRDQDKILRGLDKKMRSSLTIPQIVHFYNLKNDVGRLFAEKDKFSDQTIGLIAHFIDFPGIERIISKLLSIDQEKGRLGVFEELYHASLLEQEGYRIVAFDVVIKDKTGSVLLQIDLMVERNNEMMAVEVHHSEEVNSVSNLSGTIRSTRVGNNKYDNYGSFYEGLRHPEGNLYAQQLKEQLGQEALVLINRVKNDVGYSPKLITSVSLIFGSEFLESKRKNFMSNLASNPGMHLDCLSNSITPILIVRRFSDRGKASRDKVVIQGQERLLTVNHVNDLEDAVKGLMAPRNFVKFLDLIDLSDGQSLDENLKSIPGFEQENGLSSLFYNLNIEKRETVKVYYLTKPDEAMLPASRVVRSEDTGGINLDPAQMSMQVKKEGEDFKFNFNGRVIDAAQVTGVIFNIRQMIPVTNLSFILGSSQEPAERSRI